MGWASGQPRKGTFMYSHWHEELLALVTRYGEQCGQQAAERVRGIHGHPPANRAAAWAAIMVTAAAATAAMEDPDMPGPSSTTKAHRKEEFTFPNVTVRSNGGPVFPLAHFVNSSAITSKLLLSQGHNLWP